MGVSEQGKTIITEWRILKSISKQYDWGDCFFCGESNPVGLKLTFYETDAEPKELVCR
jgi:hypothetical protein